VWVNVRKAEGVRAVRNGEEALADESYSKTTS
jgi:hypothetical protein